MHKLWALSSGNGQQMGRVIVLNDAARAMRSRSVVLSRQRHQLQLVAKDAASPRRSTADRVERVVWVVALWTLFVAYIVVLTPPDLGRSVVRFQASPTQVAKPSATDDPTSRPEPVQGPRYYAANR
ncbi:MAG: hypothetical protein ABSD31_08310 [Candidatus Binataceae bacterium]